MDADQRELAWIVTIADGVTEICDNALNGYKNLKTVTILASVTVLGNHLFADCPNLERIYFEGDAPRMGHYIFDYDAPVIFYYYEDRDGWTNPWCGRTALKRPAKTETPLAAASVTAAYAGVLRGENAFIDSYSGKWQGLASLQAEDMEPEYISVTDLD